MAEREISIHMQSKYTSDVSKQLRNDQKRMQAFQRVLNKSPLRIPIKLDYSDAIGQVSKIRKAILGEFAKIPSSILGADGRPASAPASSGKPKMNPVSGTLDTSQTKTWNKKGGPDKKGAFEYTSSRNEQLANGRTEKTEWDKNGDFKRSVTKDISNVKELADSLRTVNQELGKVYAKASAKGDSVGKIQSLRAQAKNIAALLESVREKGLEHSPVYAKAEDRLSRIQQRISGMNGSFGSAAEKKAFKGDTRAYTKASEAEYRRAQGLLKQNKIEEASAGAINDKYTREQALNKVYADRKQIFEESRNAFRAMDLAQQGKGRLDLADRAARATAVQHNQVDQVDVERARMDSERAKAAQAAIDKQDKLNATAAAKAQRVADAAAKSDKNRNFGRSLRLDDHATKTALAANLAEEAAAKALPDRTAREAELNRVLAARQQIHQDSAQRLGRIQQSATAAGDHDHAAKAEAAKLKAQQSAGKAGVGQVKADSAAQLAAAAEAAANQKTADAKAANDRRSAFKQEMQDIKTHGDQKIAAINNAERNARAAAKTVAEKRAISRQAHLDRVAVHGGMSGAYSGVESRARAAGHGNTADAARGKVGTAATAAARDVERFSSATAKSGHALNFHTGSLLKNAATFASWMVPMRAVTSVAQAFGAGIAGATKVDRQFATLSAVFHGTAEEAQKLKTDTLALAVAQGRSTDEAMDSSIRWSRLGLTRVQVLEATRVSLMAANVAEISAAEAAEKLSGIYATYRLNIGDLAGVLNRLNSISNNYNVTVDDLFQGISRVSGVAKSSGLALRDLEGIIGSVVGAGGGTGAEVGNALKFVLTRLGDSEVGDKLKKAFDIDLTGPNGDLKDMSQIMGELAALYPTLNKAEQQHFLQLTAGARQASRFSKVMTEYSQGQILAAKAGFDHAASLRENEKILASLQSRLDAVSASWTSFFTAMGDAGAFEFVIQSLRGVQAGVEAIDRAVKRIKPPESNGIKINDVTDAATVENLGGGFDVPILVREGHPEEQVMRTTVLIGEALKARREMIKEHGDRMGNLSMRQKFNMGGGAMLAGDDEKISEQGLLVHQKGTAKFEIFDSAAEAEKAMQRFLDKLAKGGDSGTADAVAKIVNEVTSLRDELEATTAAAGVFDSLGDRFANGSVDRETAIRQFQSMSYLLTQLDGDQTIFNQSLATFNQLLASGDKAAMAEFLKGLGGKFTGKLPGITTSLQTKSGEGTLELSKKLSWLEAQKHKLASAPTDGSPKSLADKQEAIKAIDAEIKTITGSIESLNAAATKLDDAMNTAFSVTAVGQMNRYLADVLVQAELVSEALGDLAPDAANDPVARIFSNKRQQLERGRDYLKSIEAATNAAGKPQRQGAREKIADAEALLKTVKEPEKISVLKAEIDLHQKIIDQQDAADLMAKTRVQDEEARIAQLHRKLDIQENIANVARAETDSGKAAANRSRAFRFGETESDKDANQARGVIERMKRNLAGAEYGMGDQTPTGIATTRGSVLQDEATARGALASMEQRNYDLDAARRQVAYDTLKAMKEQAVEASKRLMLASREDQLRAAALSKTLRDKGPVKDNEFFALSQESRQAFTNYLPNQAPDQLNEAKQAARKNLTEINDEQRRLTRSIGNVSGALAALAERITKDTQKGGSLDSSPPAPPDPLQNPANTPKDQSPLVNLNVGSVAVTMQLSDQVNKLLTTYVDHRFTAEIKALELRLSRPLAPNSQGATE